DLQPRPVSARIAGRVEAFARAGVDQLLRRVGRPLLGVAPVAVPQLDLRAVRRARARHVEALAQRADRAVRADRPLLSVGAVAVVELDGGAVGAVRAGDVDALAAEAGDRAGLAGAAAVALGAVPGERRRRLAGQGVGERRV